MNIARFVLAGLAAATLGACGLIDPDIADFDLSLPEKEVVVDTAQWQLTSEESMPAIDCSENPGICSAGIGELCGAEGFCFGSCNAEQTCDLKILVSLFHSFDLAAEKPELAEIEGQPLVSVEIKKIAYRVDENTLNVDSPELSVYVGPEGTISPGSAQAKKIGTIEPIPAGTTIEEGEIILTADGRAVLASFMKDYSVPFHIVVGAEVDVKPGQTVPTGRLSATVLVTAVAGI